MKRGNSWGPGVSQFSGLQAGLDHGVEQLGPGVSCNSGPPGAVVLASPLLDITEDTKESLIMGLHLLIFIVF